MTVPSHPCPYCGQPVPVDARFCGTCARPLEEAEDGKRTMLGMAPPADAPEEATPPSQPAANPFVVGGDTEPVPRWGGLLAQPGTLFGFPLARLRDEAERPRVLLACAALLLASRVVPLFHSGATTRMAFGDPPGLWSGLLWPLLVGAAFLTPLFLAGKARRFEAAGWLPLAAAYLSCGAYFVAVPFASGLAIAGSFALYPGSSALVAWFYPVLIVGLLARLEDRSGLVPRILIAVGAGYTLIGGFSGVDSLFRLSGLPGFVFLHNALWLVVLGVVAGTLLFVPTARAAPGLLGTDAFVPLATAVLLAWMPVGALLVGGGMMADGSVVNGLLLLLHILVLQVAFVGALVWTASLAVDALRRIGAR